MNKLDLCYIILVIISLYLLLIELMLRVHHVDGFNDIVYNTTI